MFIVVNLNFIKVIQRLKYPRFTAVHQHFKIFNSKYFIIIIIIKIAIIIIIVMNFANFINFRINLANKFLVIIIFTFLW